MANRWKFLEETVSMITIEIHIASKGSGRVSIQYPVCCQRFLRSGKEKRIYTSEVQIHDEPHGGVHHFFLQKFGIDGFTTNRKICQDGSRWTCYEAVVVDDNPMASLMMGQSVNG